MIEVSKYADRLMEVLDRMEMQATVLGIPFPKISERDNLKLFFNDLYQLRGDSTAAQQEEGFKAALGRYEMPNNAKEIDRKMLTILAQINAWTATLHTTTLLK